MGIFLLATTFSLLLRWLSPGDTYINLLGRHVVHFRSQNWPVTLLLAAQEMYLESICEHKH
jgi:hypothetical protein